MDRKPHTRWSPKEEALFVAAAAQLRVEHATMPWSRLVMEAQARAQLPKNRHKSAQAFGLQAARDKYERQIANYIAMSDAEENRVLKRDLGQAEEKLETLAAQVAELRDRPPETRVQFQPRSFMDELEQTSHPLARAVLFAGEAFRSMAAAWEVDHGEARPEASVVPMAPPPAAKAKPEFRIGVYGLFADQLDKVASQLGPHIELVDLQAGAGDRSKRKSLKADLPDCDYYVVNTKFMGHSEGNRIRKEAKGRLMFSNGGISACVVTVQAAIQEMRRLRRKSA